MEYIYTFNMLSLKGIKTYEEWQRKSDFVTFQLRKAKAMGDVRAWEKGEAVSLAFDNEGTIEKVRGLMSKSASLDDEPNTKMGELDLYVKPGVTDSEGVSHAEEKRNAAWKPLGRVPNGARGRGVNRNSVKANRYLEYQEERIKKAINKGEVDKAVIIGLLLLKNSYSYQVLLLNKVLPNGHHALSMAKAKKLMEEVVRLCRSSTFRLFISRFYILKADGVRGRPIGSPNFPSRVISRGINDLIYAIFKPEKHQHGYVKGRSCGTAIGSIIQRLKQNPKVVYEFDLKSFFNTVDISAVYEILKWKSKVLAEVVWKVYYELLYRLPKEGIREEMELKYIGKRGRKTKYPVYQRDGMPQGLSISPILSVLALDNYETPDGVEMYSDDGIYMGDSMDPFNKWVGEIKDSGVEIAGNKSKEAGDEIKFVGCVINRKTRTVSFNGKHFSWDHPNLLLILERIYTGYGERKGHNPGTGHIDGGSFTALFNPGIHCPFDLPIWDFVLIVGSSIMGGLPHMGYRWFPGKGIIDIIGGSSYACDWMLSIKKELNLGVIKPLCPTLKGSTDLNLQKEKGVMRSKYYELIGNPGYDSSVRMFLGVYNSNY